MYNWMLCWRRNNSYIIVWPLLIVIEVKWWSKDCFKMVLSQQNGHSFEQIKILISTNQKRSHLADIDDFELKLNETTLMNTSCHRLLGVTIQQNLSWSAHISKVCQKVRSKLYILFRLKDCLPFHARRQFFNSFILPHFDFCLSIWGW